MFVRKCVTVSSVLISRKLHRKIGVIGVPFNKGQTKSGVEEGPKVLRQSGLLKDLSEIHSSIDVKDYGDIICESNNSFSINNMLNWSQVAECNRQLSLKVAEIIRENRVCLTLGGDHSIALGSVDGHMQTCNPEKLALIWVDAHADLNTSSSSPSGNLHGMPLALLVHEMKEEWPELPFVEWQNPLLSLKNVAYIGLRSVDSYERYIIDKYKITAFDMKDIQILGIQNIIKMCLQKIDPDSDCFLHVSFDIDSLDALEAPSTGTPVRGGLTLREGIEIMEAICETNRLKVMDLVEVNPKIGNERDVKTTVDAAKQIILAAFGHKRKGVKR